MNFLKSLNSDSFDENSLVLQDQEEEILGKSVIGSTLEEIKKLRIIDQEL